MLTTENNCMILVNFDSCNGTCTQPNDIFFCSYIVRRSRLLSEIHTNLELKWIRDY